MTSLDDLLGDADAVSICSHLIQCYQDEVGLDVLTAPSDDIAPSASFVSQTAGKSTEQVKATVENLSHALLVVKALRHKLVLNNTSDLIKSMDEVDTFLELLNDVTDSVDLMREGIESRYQRPVSLYRALEGNLVCLERICTLQSYVVECMDVLASLRTLSSQVQQLGTSLEDFAALLETSHTLAELIARVSSLQPSEARDVVDHQCQQLKAEVLHRAFEKGVLTLLRRQETPSSDPEADEPVMKRLAVCHHIFRELGAAPACTLRLVDEMVSITEKCLDLRQLLAAGTAHNMWQQFFVSQLAEFMAKYKTGLLALYTFCRSINYRLSDHLDPEEQHLLKASRLLSQPHSVHHDPLEVFAACELYAKRCVGLLQTVFQRLEAQPPAHGRFDVAMLAPQLISIGEGTHAELRRLNIPFNLHAHYFKSVCERYAKEFMANAAERLLPASKSVFAACVRVLHQHGVRSLKGLPPERELQVASDLLHALPADLGLAHVMYEFLDKSHSCETLHRHVLQVAHSALQNVLEVALEVSTEAGSRLLLSDGGSKISLKRPNDAHSANARVHQYVTSFAGVVEPCLLLPLDLESPLFRTVQACKSLPVIARWADDVGATFWHTVSYISSGGCQEFGWFLQQVLTATQHIVKICNFLRENYFDPLVPLGRSRLFRRLATHAIASFVIYAITLWPLEEDDKIALLSVVTELEMALAEILRESLPKLESDYLTSLRRLLYLGDELFATLQSPDFQAACLSLPVDVISLHVLARVVKSPHVPSDVREELARAPVHRFLGDGSTHATLERFRDALLLHRPDQPSPPAYGRRFAEYLQQFGSLEPVHLLRVEVDLAVPRLHAAFDAQHLAEALLVAVQHLELAPVRPELLVLGRVAQLRAVGEDGPRPVDLAQPALHLDVHAAELARLIVVDELEALLVDAARLHDPVELGRLGQVELDHRQLVLLGGAARRVLEHAEAAAHQPELLLHVRVQKKQVLDVLRRDLPGVGGVPRVDALVEYLARALQLAAAVALDELGEVRQVEVVELGPLEERHALFEDAEGRLEVPPVLQVHGEVERDLRRDHLQLHHQVEGRAAGGHRAQVLLQVEAEAPQLDGAVEPLLHVVGARLVPHVHGLPHQLERPLEVLVSEVQLHPRAPHRGQVVYKLEIPLHRLFVHPISAIHVALGLEEPGVRAPELRHPAHGLPRVHCSDGLLVYLLRPLRVAPHELRVVQPVVHVVHVLLQLDVRQQHRPRVDQVLQPVHRDDHLRGGPLRLVPLLGELLQKPRVHVEYRREILHCGHRLQRLLQHMTAAACH
ncbi:conserved oligomeric Golgi complex subunit 5, putative [Babesia caballi]|uniref:Conserved oligomeric Golgi complex subunit 5, putative n=1 Tax=Babesia caballi TaxID=5871 RepID=A0AAV4M0I5_BABCB|nr:conserved oligomeric Golgi complex subunit 5, putative [Babesia caballi]